MKITIKLKLLISFIVMALLSGIVGYIGVSEMNKINEAGVTLYEKVTIPIANVGKINSDFNLMRFFVVSLTVTQDTKEIEDIAANINKLNKNITDEYNNFKKTVLTAEGLKITENFWESYQNYYKKLENVVSFAKQNKMADALAVIKGEAKICAGETLAALTKMFDTKISVGKGVADNNSKIAGNAVVSMYSFVGFALLLGVLIGLIVPAGINKAISVSINEAKYLAESIINGKLDVRGDSNKVNFEFAGIINGINEIINSFVSPINVTAKYINRISKGDMPAKITDEYKGDFNEIKNNLNQCIDAVSLLIKDADMLASAAANGNFSARADAQKHYGDYQKIVTGMNNTFESFVGPLTKSMEHLEHISDGIIDENITMNYAGDFNKLKISFNKCFNAVNLLIEDANMLADAAVEGKLDIRANAQKHKGDFRRIIEGVNSTLNAVVMPVNEARGCLEKLAQGNLDVAMTGDYKGDHAILKDALNATVNSMNEILLNVRTTVEQVSTGANQVSMASQSLSQSSTEAASSLEEISASMQQINSQAKQNTENAVTANQVSSQAKTSVDEGNAKMNNMLLAMREISESANNISKIIKAIDEIAFQTNLLALNAAVEAARAGKHGKGFTVVAEEVRNLAQRSAKAAKETAEMIENAIARTENGMEMADSTAKVLTEIAGGATKSTDLMGEIAAASKEQMQGIIQISQGLTQLDQVTQQNTATAEEAASASEELSSQAEQLRVLIEKFILKDESGTVNAYVRKDSRLLKQAHDEALNIKKLANKNKESIKTKKENIEKSDGNNKIQISLDDNEFGKF
ncbi:MAG: methyl-accepting chemotaxis protein [Candidatus Wallbacteria bacterium]